MLPRKKGVNKVQIVWMLKFRRKLANNFQIFEVFGPRFDKDCGSELILLLLTFMVDTKELEGVECYCLSHRTQGTVTELLKLEASSLKRLTSPQSLFL